MESDLDRYFKDQSTPVRSAVFDITFDRAIKQFVEQTGMKQAEVMANEKLYNAALAKAQEANDRSVWGHDAKKDRNGKWIEQSIPLNLNHFAALRKAEGEESYWAAVSKYWRENPKHAEAIRLSKPPRAA